MAVKEDKLPPALRALDEKIEQLSKDETHQISQLAYMIRELRKQRKTQKDLERILPEIWASRANLVRATVTSLQEYREIRLLIPTNEQMLSKVRKTVLSIEKDRKNLESLYERTQAQLKEFRHERDKWHRLLPFRRP